MYDITTEDLPEQTWLTLTSSLPREQISAFLGRSYQDLFGVLSAAGAPPSGPPTARYHVRDDIFDVTAGVPFDTPLTVEPPSSVQTIPATTIATTTHVGPYEGLPAAFHAVMEWIEANGYRIAADPWESYLDGPEVPEPRTQVCFPVEVR